MVVLDLAVNWPEELKYDVLNSIIVAAEVLLLLRLLKRSLVKILRTRGELEL